MVTQKGQAGVVNQVSHLSVPHYSVTKRIMDGSSLAFYVLEQNNPMGGRKPFIINADRDMTIRLIDKGIIDNMRYTSDGDKKVIGGRLINLNELPRLNLKSPLIETIGMGSRKGRFKFNSQYELGYFLRSNDNIVGYGVIDNKGANLQVTVPMMFQMVSAGFVVGVMIGVNDMLEGIDFKIENTPVANVVFDASGKIVNISTPVSHTSNRTAQQAVKRTNAQGDRVVIVRVTQANKPGILTGPPSKKDIESGKSISEAVFKKGDCIVCGANGALYVVHASDVGSKLDLDPSKYVGRVAICDGKMPKLSSYYYRLFEGNREAQFDPATITRSWKAVGARTNG